MNFVGSRINDIDGTARPRSAIVNILGLVFVHTWRIGYGNQFIGCCKLMH